MFAINGSIWAIAYVEPFSPYLMRSDGTYAVGMCDSNINTVFINNRLEGSFLQKVLTHEICHAAMMSYSISLAEQQEELICDIIATYGREIIEIADEIFYQIKRQVA